MAFLRPILLAIAFFTTQVSAQRLVEDDFEDFHDFKTSGITGTPWSGLLNANNATQLQSLGDGTLKMAVSAYPSAGFENDLATAPFLFVNVSGDFTATVHVSSSSINSFSDSSLMALGQDGSFNAARAFHTAGEFDSRYYQGDPIEHAKNKVRAIESGPVSITGYLRMDRQGNKYDTYSSFNGTDWTLTSSYEFRSGDLLESDLMLGLAYGTYGFSNGYTHFSNFNVYMIPEPRMWMLGTLGLAALILRRRRAAN